MLSQSSSTSGFDLALPVPPCDQARGASVFFLEVAVLEGSLVFQMSQPSAPWVMGLQARATMPGSLKILILSLHDSVSWRAGKTQS